MYRVLIADDEAHILRGMSSYIKNSDLALTVVATCDNGEDALALTKKYSPEILLLDINMPKLSGLSLIEKIREFDELCEIIIISGYDRFDYAQKAIDLNVGGYLLKPVEEEELYKQIKKCLKNYAERQSLRINQIAATKEELYSEESIVRYVKESFLTEPMTMQDIMEKFSRSRSSIYKIFKTLTHMGFSEYVTFLKMEHAKELLITSSLSIKEISNLLGYTEQQYFSRLFKRQTGVSPSEYKETRK